MMWLIAEVCQKTIDRLIEKSFANVIFFSFKQGSYMWKQVKDNVFVRHEALCALKDVDRCKIGSF